MTPSCMRSNVSRGIRMSSIYLATGQEHYRAAYLWDELGFRPLEDTSTARGSGT